ncbi:hypothetical protein GGR57DRAFT_468578 [Xylariaceae sp. FL1272]|nr:hypothetical protein GGR57DRAFT_468578 [Xylariaceae sp. FL1272]
MAAEEIETSIRKLSVDSLDSAHSAQFSRSLENVLSSEVAQLTYGQIVDGLPIASVESDTGNNGMGVGLEHPIHDEDNPHDKLCPGVMERLQELRDKFDISSLKFDSHLIYDFNRASPGSRAFHTRLIEMIAVAIHQIAVQLYQSETTFHVGDPMASWEPPADSIFLSIYDEMFKTLFRHRHYCDYDQYPNGIADGVGYWAENHILGGVVLFDRRELDSPLTPSNEIEVDPNAIYFHSDRDSVTYRIYRLLDHQRQDLVKFLVSDSSAAANACPIPILGSSDNIQRIDPEEALLDTGVFRDLWERKTLSPDEGDPRDRCVWDKLDYVTMDDFSKSRLRRALRSERIRLEDSEQEEGDEL